MKAAVVIAASMVMFAGGAGAQEVTYTGVGSVPVARDASAVRSAAEEAARLDLVRAMARQVLGAERLAELAPDVVTRIANQIRPEMIVDRRAERVGSDYRATLVASIDRAWFQALLDDEGIRSSSDLAGGGAQRILVLLDESVGPARDYARPENVTVEYDRDTSASFRDQSSTRFSEREAAATSSRVAGASVSEGGYSDRWGAGAARSGSAYRAQSGAAYARNQLFIDQNDVEASARDVVRYRYSETYQVAATSAFGQAAIAALTGELISHDVATANAVASLAEFAPGVTPLYGELQSSGRLRDFFTHAYSRSNAPFFLGGQLNIRDGGPHTATGQATCTGSLTVSAFATSTAEDVAAAQVSGEMAGSSYELCASRLAEDLARQAAERVGPQVQRYWRSRSRDVAAVVEAAQTGGDFMLVVRGNLSLGAQADILDALTQTPGVQSHAFVEQAPGQMSIQVSYSGAAPLHLALYQRLRGNPIFSNLDAQTAGRTVTLCMSGC